MTIELTPEQQEWIVAHVARGEFATIEQAARQLIDERIAERTTEESEDLTWARHHVDEALDEISRGEIVTAEAHRARMTTLIASLKG